MLQNKIYQNFIKEILKTFIVILFGLSIIAWTVRAVNFLDLIVESGYSISTYFQYSILNLLSILTKFIPLSFLLALVIFIIKLIQDNEFIILWTSGIKKIKIVNLFFIISLFILTFYLFFSVFLTPLALNKSRYLLSIQNFNSFLPTIRIKGFSDSFEGFTFYVEEKIDNKIKNVFIYDKSNVLKNLSTDQSNTSSRTIIAKSGIVEGKRIILFNGQLLSSTKDNKNNNVIKFEQLNIDLASLQTGNIKQPKLQETSTYTLLKCIMNIEIVEEFNCTADSKKEITSVLNRRIILPFYILIISLICSFLLIKNHNKKNIFLNKYTIFAFSFLLLLYSELIIRYTGISRIVNILFIISPIIMLPLIYTLLIIKFSKESLYK